jgi:predicted SAM-dependent methyltransferase
MSYIDKNNLLTTFSNSKNKIVLELGCGNSKQFQNSIAIDIVDMPGVDIICDLNKGFSFIPDNSVDEIYSSHFMEHIDDLGVMMREIYRILKPGGRKIMTVPHFSNPYYYSDYTHRNAFGLYSLCYFSKSIYFKRQVPVFYNDIDFQITSVKIEFKSRWKIQNFFVKQFGKIVNHNKTLLEYYEANWCYAIPAYELKFIIEKV